jgi:hypothetical protein
VQRATPTPKSGVKWLSRLESAPRGAAVRVVMTIVDAMTSAQRGTDVP